MGVMEEFLESFGFPQGHGRRGRRPAATRSTPTKKQVPAKRRRTLGGRARRGPKRGAAAMHASVGRRRRKR